MCMIPGIAMIQPVISIAVMIHGKNFIASSSRVTNAATVKLIENSIPNIQLITNKTIMRLMYQQIN